MPACSKLNVPPFIERLPFALRQLPPCVDFKFIVPPFMDKLPVDCKMLVPSVDVKFMFELFIVSVPSLTICFPFVTVESFIVRFASFERDKFIVLLFIFTYPYENPMPEPSPYVKSPCGNLYV